MAAYASNAYDFDIEYFETASSAAPAKKQEKKKAAPLKKVAPRSREELNREEVRGLKKSVLVLSFVVVVFAMVALQISASAHRYELVRAIQYAESEIKIAQSENVRLNAELNGITGIAKIDSYATDVLGMTKVENYQIECIDLSEGDAVLYSSSLLGG